MPRQKTKEELLDRIDELEAENETLQDQVDSIADIIEGEEENEIRIRRGSDEDGRRLQSHPIEQSSCLGVDKAFRAGEAPGGVNEPDHFILPAFRLQAIPKEGRLGGRHRI